MWNGCGGRHCKSNNYYFTLEYNSTNLRNRSTDFQLQMYIIRFE